MEENEKIGEERTQMKYNDIEKNLSEKSQSLLIAQIKCLQSISASNSAHVVDLQTRNLFLEAHILSLQAQTFKLVGAVSEEIPAIITNDVKRLELTKTPLAASVYEIKEMCKKKIDHNFATKENIALLGEVTRISRNLQEVEALAEKFRGEIAILKMTQEKSAVDILTGRECKEGVERESDPTTNRFRKEGTKDIEKGCSSFEMNRNVFESKSVYQLKLKAQNKINSISKIEAARKNQKKIKNIEIPSNPICTTGIIYSSKETITNGSSFDWIENSMHVSPLIETEFLQHSPLQHSPLKPSPIQDSAEIILSPIQVLEAQKKFKAQLAQSAKQQWMIRNFENLWEEDSQSASTQDLNSITTASGMYHL